MSCPLYHFHFARLDLSRLKVDAFASFFDIVYSRLVMNVYSFELVSDYVLD